MINMHKKRKTSEREKLKMKHTTKLKLKQSHLHEI